MVVATQLENSSGKGPGVLLGTGRTQGSDVSLLQKVRGVLGRIRSREEIPWPALVGLPQSTLCNSGLSRKRGVSVLEIPAENLKGD